jgi:hypothetical protein
MSDSTGYFQVLELLRAESEAIAKAAERLQAAELDRVLSILNSCKGKIVLLGVGNPDHRPENCGDYDQQWHRCDSSPSIGRFARRSGNSYFRRCSHNVEQ